MDKYSFSWEKVEDRNMHSIGRGQTHGIVTQSNLTSLLDQGMEAQSFVTTVEHLKLSRN